MEGIFPSSLLILDAKNVMGQEFTKHFLVELLFHVRHVMKSKVIARNAMEQDFVIVRMQPVLSVKVNEQKMT